MTQTDGLIDLGALVEGERRWFSLGQNLDLDHLDLDLARSEITVGGVVGPQAYLAGHLRHVLAAEVVARVDDALHDTGAVAQIDEARCSPCSRRRSTQPHTETVRPASAAVSWPHMSVRIEVV